MVRVVPNDRYASLKPGAAAAALHSFPQRFRAPFAADPTRSPDDIAQLATPDGRTVRDVLAATAHALEVLGDALGKVLIADDVALPALAVRVDDATAAAGRDASVPELLERIETAATAAARQVESATASALLRTGAAPGGETVTAIDLARQAIRPP